MGDRFFEGHHRHINTLKFLINAHLWPPSVLMTSWWNRVYYILMNFLLLKFNFVPTKMAKVHMQNFTNSDLCSKYTVYGAHTVFSRKYILNKPPFKVSSFTSKFLHRHFYLVYKPLQNVHCCHSVGRRRPPGQYSLGNIVPPDIIHRGILSP